MYQFLFKNMEIARPQSKQPMPPHAKLVFKGKIFDVYQWEQEGYDGTKHTFEKIIRLDTVVVIPVLPTGKIIVSKQEQPLRGPFYGFLGGRIEEGEDALLAAQRELLEESGYESNEWSLFTAVQPVTKIDWAIYTFIAHGAFKTHEPELDGGEKIELLEVTFEEFIDMCAEGKLQEEDLTLAVLRAQANPEKMRQLKAKILG